MLLSNVLEPSPPACSGLAALLIPWRLLHCQVRHPEMAEFQDKPARLSGFAKGSTDRICSRPADRIGLEPGVRAGLRQQQAGAGLKRAPGRRALRGRRQAQSMVDCRHSRMPPAASGSGEGDRGQKQPE